MKFPCKNGLYSCLVDQINEYGFVILDMDGNIKKWNGGAEKIKGYTKDEIVGQNFRIFYLPEDRESKLPEKVLNDVMEYGCTSYEGWRIRKDGTKFWGNILLSALWDNENNITGFTKIVRDFTQVKNQIEFDHNNLNALINNTSDLMWSIDRDYRLITSNRSFDEFVKGTSGLKIEKGNSVFLCEHLKKMKPNYDKAFLGESVVTVEQFSISETNWYEFSFQPIDDSDALQGIACHANNITGRIISEQKINQLNSIYAFISQVNQNIVYSEDEQVLFQNLCRISTDFGRFKAVWVGGVNLVAKQISLVSASGLNEKDAFNFANISYNENSRLDSILQSGNYFVCNCIEELQGFEEWLPFCKANRFHAFISLPLRTAGLVTGIINLYTSEPNFFNEEIVTLLEETCKDISFALTTFQKERMRVLAEEKLKYSELRLKQAQEIANLGSWDINYSTGISNWSEESCRIYGLNPNENTQSYESWLSFIHADDVDQVIKKVKEIETNLTPGSFYHRILRKDGNVRYIHTKSNFEYDRDGNLIGLFGTSHDITEKKLVEEQLKLSKANLRLVVDLMPQALFAMDKNGKFVFVNKSFAGLYGTDPKNLVNRTIFETIPNKNIPSFFVGLAQEVIESGLMKTIPEVVFTDHNGTSRIFYFNAIPFQPTGKKEKTMLGIFLDVTEQKKAENERAKIIDDIILRNKDLEQFSYIISHNLRAPVVNIMGIADLLSNGTNSREEEIAMISMLINSINKLDDVIKDLNNILRLKHQVHEKKESVKFSGILDDIKISITNLLDNHDVKITSDFSSIGEKVTIKSYLYSIFFNLISNSIKFKKEGTQPTIEITSRKMNNGLELIFKDNGLGIDLEKRGGQVFGLYKRFHDHAEGKGMGLYMVKNQVELLGGKIYIESKVNQGTSFRITFDEI